MDDMLSRQHKPCDEMKAPLLVAEVNFISRDSKNILPPKNERFETVLLHLFQPSQLICVRQHDTSRICANTLATERISFLGIFLFAPSLLVWSVKFRRQWCHGPWLFWVPLFNQKRRAIAPTLDLHPNPPEPDTLIHRSCTVCVTTTIVLLLLSIDVLYNSLCSNTLPGSPYRCFCCASILQWCRSSYSRIASSRVPDPTPNFLHFPIPARESSQLS